MASVGPTVSVFHPIILTALGVIFSVGIAYGALGSGIQANTKDIVDLKAVTANVNDLITKQAVADSVQKTQGRNIAKILRILEDE